MKLIENIILCIKYPFLYPRNRFTGRHYTNWKLEYYINGKPPKYKVVKDGETYKHELETPATLGLKHKARVSFFAKIWLWIVERFYDLLGLLHCIPTYTELDAMEPGWRKAFGNQMMEELKQQCKKDHCNIAIMQIKEKFGELRFYIGSGTSGIYEIINKYEDLSRKTCGRCGKPATKITEGYIYPYCDECYSKIESQPDYTCVNS